MSIDLLMFAHQLHGLKHLARTGWQKRGLSIPESVGSHTFGVAFWTIWLMYWEKGKDTTSSFSMEKALLMAFVHDFPETAVGDLIPIQKSLLFGKKKQEQKEAVYQAEKEFWTRVSRLLSKEKIREGQETFSCIEEDASLRSVNQKFCDFLEGMWEEYREKKTDEAHLVKRADALDCVMQAIIYRELFGIPVKVFSRLIEHASGQDDELRSLLFRCWETEDFIEALEIMMEKDV